MLPSFISDCKSKHLTFISTSYEDEWYRRDANCSFFAVFSTFFKLQILVILSKMPQNTFFQGSLCVHFYGNKMKNTVFQAKIPFFILKNTFFSRKRLASLVPSLISNANDKHPTFIFSVIRAKIYRHSFRRERQTPDTYFSILHISDAMTNTQHLF